MSVEILKGDLLKSDCHYICHQVNCRGKMASGVALAIRNKYPVVYEKYMKRFNETLPEENHGGIQPVAIEFDAGHIASNTEKCVLNMFAQYDYGYDGKRYTSYDAFWECLNRIKEFAVPGATIGFPGNVGCCRGGANWNIILAMITEVLGKDFEVKIYFLED